MGERVGLERGSAERKGIVRKLRALLLRAPRLRVPNAASFCVPRLLSAIIFLPLILASPQPLTWTEVNTPGFGEHAGPYIGQEAFDLTVFNGQLYLGMEGKTCARIWRSRAGITAPSRQSDWEQVVGNGFDGTTDCAVVPPTTDNDHIDSLEPFRGHLYASTAMQTNQKRGTQVWRSATGDAGSWMRVNEPGFGLPSNENFKDMIEYSGLLCGGTGNPGGRGGAPGAQVWCTDGITPDAAHPGRLLWTQRNVNGFGAAENRKIWSSATHDGALYFGVEAAGQDGSLWRTRNIDDPQAWELVFSPRDVGLAARRVDALQAFGGQLFIGMEAPGVGAVIVSSASGDRYTWQTARPEGFGKTSGRFISDASTTLDGALYVATLDEAVGAGIWMTRNGRTWAEAAARGFGRPSLFAAQLAAFNGRLYAWTSDYTVGQGVWRGEPASGN
jgi:hypothetical protein